MRRVASAGLPHLAALPLLAVLGALGLLGPPAVAAEFLVVFDHSGSMGSGRSIEPAKDALRRAMVQMSDDPAVGGRVSWGLRVYGTGCCTPDTRLVVPVSPDGRRRIVELLPGIRGIASSPMPAALRAARLEDFGESSVLERRHVVVVSDGEVDREGACREARLLRQAGVRVTILGLEAADTPEGSETLRHIATHPRCAAGHYVRIDRPDLLAEALGRWGRAVLTLPFRLLALLLATVAGYYTTKFFEYALERMTPWPKRFIPRTCNAVFVTWVSASAGVFLGLPVWLWLTLALVPGTGAFWAAVSGSFRTTGRGRDETPADHAHPTN